MENAPFTIETVSWSKARKELLDVRTAVFVHEQGVPQEMEEDEFDEISVHFLARDAHGKPIGTARLLPDGKVGRVAVLAPLRRKRVGQALMMQVVKAWREKEGSTSPLSLHAQVSSIPFYESLGFSCIGPEFLEAGIPHRKMSLSDRAGE